MNRNLSKKQQALVIEGNEVKLRLQADRIKSGGVVHVDWLRFTCELKNAPVPVAEVLFPGPLTDTLENPRSIAEQDLEQYRRTKLLRILREMPDAEFAASAQAHALALKVCKALGPDFSVDPQLNKGKDFYRFRWSITRNDAEVGWVGFLASSESPKLDALAKTINVNVFGSACTFARGDWRHRMANLIEEVNAKITRIDYALDFFDGIRGGLERRPDGCERAQAQGQHRWPMGRWRSRSLLLLR
ncbi:MAG: hypothetical protein L0H10_01570 [Comamonas sp.]|uniref:hypothetical protein n=1 Tax=Comamonas sp. TaxID=34028 RepID=UPI002648EED0|nr:hypothetical protein [Comamonas sp.]MDN5502501.1 hypothetical protein [Comamonas sp.]MDN5535692.1 hypothetical protein [Comamonas sp.]